MKKILLSLSLSIILLNSCTARVVSSSKPYSDDKVTTGKTYNFFTKDGKSKMFQITKIDEVKIYGIDPDGKESFVEKSNIVEIKKNKFLATVGLVVGVIGLVVIADAYYHQKTIL